jgi:peroxiredoxin
MAVSLRVAMTLCLATCAATLLAADQSKDPEAILRSATDRIKAAKAYTADFDLEVKAGLAGQELGRAVSYKFAAQRPNRFLFLRTDGELGATIVSDGKKMLKYSPELQQYTEGAAPATLDEFSSSLPAMMTLEGGMGGYMLALLADDPAGRLTHGVTASNYVGVEVFEGNECHRLHFESDEIAYDIWITTGDEPTVRRVLPDFSALLGEEEKEMGYKMELSFRAKNWNFAPEVTDETFTFTPPGGTELVEEFAALVPAPVEPPVVSVHPLIGQPAPGFAAVHLDGENSFELKKDLGKKVIVLDFWATWCPPCVAGLPKLAEVAADFKDKPVSVLAVNVGEEADAINEFLKENELELAVLRDAGEVAEKYQVSGIPQTVLIGLDGRVHVVHVGLPNDLKVELTTQIDALLEREDLAAKELAKTQPKADSDEASEEPSKDEPAGDQPDAEKPADEPNAP